MSNTLLKTFDKNFKTFSKILTAKTERFLKN